MRRHPDASVESAGRQERRWTNCGVQGPVRPVVQPLVRPPLSTPNPRDSAQQRIGGDQCNGLPNQNITRIVHTQHDP